MSDKSPVQTTVQRGSFNITLSGDTVQEVADKAKEAAGDLLSSLEALEQSIVAKAAVTEVAAASPVPQPPVSQSLGSPPPGPGGNPNCKHGPMQFKEGTSKAGKPYKAWFCPSTDRDNQCSPQWIK